MTDFIKDTILISEKIDINIPQMPLESLEAVILPYYMDPTSLELMVILKRSIMPGSYARTGKKMGISAITFSLPEDKPLSIEEVWEKLNLPAAMQNAIPFGSIMLDPLNTTKTFEMVVIQTEPFEFLDKSRGIILQEKGKFEIGAVKFSDIISGINSNVFTDMKTRLILNELYILAVEESNKKQDTNNMMSGNPDLIGGGSNLPSGFGNNKPDDVIKTSYIPDEVIAENAKKDFGSIYSNVKPNSGFKSI